MEELNICTEEGRKKKTLMAKLFLSDKGKLIIIFNNLNFNETNYSQICSVMLRINLLPCLKCV